MTEPLKGRVLHIQILFCLVAFVLIGKAMQIQLLDDSYRAKAEATAIHKTTVYPSRGSIFDRDGDLLILNIPIYDLMVTYNYADPKMDTMKLCSILGITKDEFKENLNKNWRDKRYSRSVPFIFLNRLSDATYARLQESLYQFPGFFVQLRNVRGYPHSYAAHMLGYLQEVDRQQVDASNGSYSPGDYIGASGLEQAYEQELRGTKGYRYVLKDNLGRIVEAYEKGARDKQNVAIAGKDLIASIDLDLQAYCEKIMQNKVGGIIAIEPSSGEILTMVSTPSYNPNALKIDRNRGKAYNNLVNSPNEPFYNRAVMAEYPPGSLFKPVVALIALQEGVMTTNRRVTCYNGYLYNGVVRPGCHSHPPCINIGQAIQHSCNAYFAHTFRAIVDKEGFRKPQLGLDVFTNHLDDFGLGRRLGVDFPQEKKGNVPTSEYYNKLYGKSPWYSPGIMSVGIGQGEMLLTNLQMANLAAIIANRGYYYTPHLIKGLRENGELQQIDDKYRIRHYVKIDPQHFEPVIEGMENVVRAGTARASFMPDISMCGKTGTAENPHGEDHSIFFAFAPKDDPKIAIAVYIEHGTEGGRAAAPISSFAIEKYLKGEISPKRKWLEQRMLDMNLIGEEDLP